MLLAPLSKHMEVIPVRIILVTIFVLNFFVVMVMLWEIYMCGQSGPWSKVKQESYGILIYTIT